MCQRDYDAESNVIGPTYNASHDLRKTEKSYGKREKKASARPRYTNHLREKRDSIQYLASVIGVITHKLTAEACNIHGEVLTQHETSGRPLKTFRGKPWDKFISAKALGEQAAVHLLHAQQMRNNENIRICHGYVQDGKTHPPKKP